MLPIESVKLQNFCETLEKNYPDYRKRQGLKHNLWFVMTGVLCGILSGYQKVGSLQRYMKNKHKFLCKATGHICDKPISDSQLRRILKHLDWEIYNTFMSNYFHISVHQVSDNEWIALDGKELRGSIAVKEDGKKENRGTTLLDAVSHKSCMVVSQTFFEGKKESEKKVAEEMIACEFLGRNLTLDALHTTPTLLGLIHQNEGRYIVQVKLNQKELYEDLVLMPNYLPMIDQIETLDKAHGRLDKRKYVSYSIDKEYFDPRWNDANIQTMTKVERESTHLKSNVTSRETSYYISNQVVIPKQKMSAKILSDAIRNHWVVENHHQIRDVTFLEDKVRTPKGNTTKILAVMRSWAINLYRKQKVSNFAEAVQNTKDNQNNIFKLFKIK